MPRLHLVELEDQPWLPRAIRDAATGYLRVVAEWTRQPEGLAAIVGEALARSGARHIVDLCSGSGGPLPRIVEVLAESGTEVTAELSDLHPDARALAAAAASSGGRVGFVDVPVDAADPPPLRRGLRTLFNGFHHLRPALAQRVLASACRDGQPIAVVEVVRRHPVALLGMLFTPLAVLAVMPFVRPLRPSFLFFTYFIPLVPLVVLWDGIVSCLRAYSPRELAELTRGLDARGYGWSVRIVPLAASPVPATVLLGLPGDAQPATR